MHSPAEKGVTLLHLYKISYKVKPSGNLCRFNQMLPIKKRFTREPHIQYGQALKCRITWHFMPSQQFIAILQRHTKKIRIEKKVIEISYFPFFCIMSFSLSRSTSVILFSLTMAIFLSRWKNRPLVFQEAFEHEKTSPLPLICNCL